MAKIGLGRRVGRVGVGRVVGGAIAVVLRALELEHLALRRADWWRWCGERRDA